MFQEFKTFIARGNVLDLAVGVIIGAAFGKVVSSLTDNVIMPVVGLLTGEVDFSNRFTLLGQVPANYNGSMTDYAALKVAGAAMIGWGDLIAQVVTFLIVAWVVFLIVKAANRFVPLPATAPPGPTEAELLAEIRDELRRRT